MSDALKPNYSSGEGVYTKILPLRQRNEVMNRWLKHRLENLLPELMDREGFDMWLVIAREYNEDPVIMSLLPEPQMAARRRTILVLTRKEIGVERLTLSRYGLGEFYQGGIWDPDEEELRDHYAVAMRLSKEIRRKISHIAAEKAGTYESGQQSEEEIRRLEKGEQDIQL